MILNWVLDRIQYIQLMIHFNSNLFYLLLFIFPSKILVLFFYGISFGWIFEIFQFHSKYCWYFYITWGEWACLSRKTAKSALVMKICALCAYNYGGLVLKNALSIAWQIMPSWYKVFRELEYRWNKSQPPAIAGNANWKRWALEIIAFPPFFPANCWFSILKLKRQCYLFQQ